MLSDYIGLKNDQNTLYHYRVWKSTSDDNMLNKNVNKFKLTSERSSLIVFVIYYYV